MISIDYLINTQELVECRFKVDTLKECDDISDILCIVVNHYQNKLNIQIIDNGSTSI